MKSPDGSTAAHPTTALAPTSGPTQIPASGDIAAAFSMPPAFDANRRRASSLDINDFPKRPMQRSSSVGWLQSLTRRASIDFTDIPLSPAESIEDIRSSGNSESRSRNSSGDVIPTIAEHGGGLVGAEGLYNRRVDRRKSEQTHMWKWKLFSVPHDDDLRRRKISETEECIQSATSPSPAPSMTSPSDVTQPSFSILNLARKMSARDLNALSPSGEI